MIENPRVEAMLYKELSSVTKKKANFLSSDEEDREEAGLSEEL